MKFTLPGDETSEADIKSGDVGWSDPVTHSAENVGSACHVLNIELEGPPALDTSK